MDSSKKIVVIGAGIGGLTTAAILAQAGLDVTVLEAHIYPGGCAGTFYHQQYHFDAGATLAGGFYPGGPMDIIAQRVGIEAWPAHASEPAMVVHLPDGSAITRWGDERRWDERRRGFGDPALPFWKWQEKTADAMWSLALQIPPWPPQTPHEMTKLIGTGIGWLSKDLAHRLSPKFLTNLVSPAWHQLPDDNRLRLFVDAQLLIAAQTTSLHANALYAASALDLPRRGIVHLEGGIGAIAETIAQSIIKHGGRVSYRKEVTNIVCKQGPNSRPIAVETKQGESFPADIIVANLTPWNIRKLLGDDAPDHLRDLPPKPEDGWGAFMVYVGVDYHVIPSDFPLHHQVIFREPLGEGNTIFLSLSPSWDKSRAPAGKRALTISTHTNLSIWWQLYSNDHRAYEERKAIYVRRMLNLASRALPTLDKGTDLILPGTPVTFQRFTKREWGWVGGFPQTNLFRAWAPRLTPGLWMVGDSIFPGQSTAAVALGGLRVADAVLRSAL